MDQIEQIVSGLMMPIIKEFNDACYYGRHPEDSLKVLNELETKLSSQLARQYVKGWNEGRKDLVQEMHKLKGIGGHK
ncbi:hypothetical protein [Ligilactobacillus animalis]|uniref:hypothetical protein n=1 Tax=Ligilactobacillus animalis TaxID=1605 RepID=UPI0010A535E9|nr:hypothetical protein [Ligilactobacillus animalis]THE20215.1 hypothetical protein ACH45_07750 [Ligilactobacillus animalis]THE21415.1 hypothetical protein ACH44_04320 [Ligilactobacillus animalis]